MDELIAYYHAVNMAITFAILIIYVIYVRYSKRD
jgi:hypothetical protein